MHGFIISNLFLWRKIKIYDYKLPYVLQRYFFKSIPDHKAAFFSICIIIFDFETPTYWSIDKLLPQKQGFGPCLYSGEAGSETPKSSKSGNTGQKCETEATWSLSYSSICNLFWIKRAFLLFCVFPVVISSEKTIV